MTTSGLSIGHIRALFSATEWTFQLQVLLVTSGSQYLRTSSIHHNLTRTSQPHSKLDVQKRGPTKLQRSRLRNCSQKLNFISAIESLSYFTLIQHSKIFFAKYWTRQVNCRQAFFGETFFADCLADWLLLTSCQWKSFCWQVVSGNRSADKLSVKIKIGIFSRILTSSAGLKVCKQIIKTGFRVGCRL